ncbi:cytochrome P450 [Streptomyces sp. NPDC005805]|uniref:cytochrome P450 family protein n=1 Tax=Streptomyces sp. NPDC005805 TaxID=3157068 RepID=UPI0033D7530C
MDEARELRSQGRLIPVTLPGDVPSWAATDLAVAHEVLTHPRLTKDPAYWTGLQDGSVPDNWELIALVRGASMLHAGGDDHRRLRRLAGGAFTRAPIDSLRGRITEITDELLDGLEAAARDGEPVDLRELFAFPLPVRVICEVLGAPGSVIAGLRTQFNRMTIPQDSADPEADIRHAVADVYRTLGKLVEDKRRAPGDDLTTALVEAHDDGDRLSEQELVETLFLIMISGHETTINAITNTSYALLTHPDALAGEALDDDATWVRVVEEGLRFTSPIRHIVLRYATDDITVAGTEIRKGEAVLASTVAANRDPSHHERPDDFDIHRPTNRDHIAFGYGAHYCLGSRLAKLETEVALRRLFTRFPDIRLASEPAQLDSVSLQGYGELLVHL